MQIVTDHFIPLLNNKSNVNEKPFLTQPQFRQFIYKAFLNEIGIQKIQLNAGPKEKGFIIKLFHQFFQLAKPYDSKFSRSNGIELLTENFSNWSFEEVKNNFKDYVERKWHRHTNTKNRVTF